MPEITISYKDNVKASEKGENTLIRNVLFLSETVLYRMYGTPRRKLCNVPQSGKQGFRRFPYL